MKEPKEDFLEQIKQALLDHEEPYDEGAWERFRMKEAKRLKPVFPIWKWAAAAAVVAGIAFLWIFNTLPVKTKNTQSDVVVNTQKNIDTTRDAINKKDTVSIKQIIPVLPNYEHQNIVKEKTDNTQHHPFIKPDIMPVPVNNNKQEVIIAQQAPQQPAQNNTVPKTDSQPAKPFYENKIVISEAPVAAKPADARQQPNTAPVIAAAKHTDNMMIKKWQSSLYVSPTFGDLGVNMGYGYSIGYAVNNKIKISSGIAHTKVSASKSFGDAPFGPPGSAAASSDANAFAARSFAPVITQYLQSVEATMSGIDIPLEVNYSFSKKIYATGGVSGLIVINDNTKKTIVSNSNERFVVKSSDGKIKEDLIQSVSSAAPANNAAYGNSGSNNNFPVTEGAGEHIPFLGFYNLSLGFKQKVSDKNAISVEPFIKVPMKNVTEQKLNYTGVGVRLKFDF